MERALDDRAAGCDGLAEATLLAVRLALDVPAEPPAPAEPSDHDTPAPIVAGDPHPRHVEILAGGLAAFGIGSAFAPGVRAGGALTLGSEAQWSIGVTGFALASRTQTLGAGAVSIGALGGGVDLCRRHRFGASWRVGLCGRAELGRLSGQARGFDTNEEAARPLVLGSLLLRAQRRFYGPLGLFAEVGGAVPIVRERFEIQGVGLVYDPPLVAATGAIGALVDFE